MRRSLSSRIPLSPGVRRAIRRKYHCRRVRELTVSILLRVAVLLHCRNGESPLNVLSTHAPSNSSEVRQPPVFRKLQRQYWCYWRGYVRHAGEWSCDGEGSLQINDSAPASVFSPFARACSRARRAWGNSQGTEALSRPSFSREP
jgi:hypothetical protein